MSLYERAAARFLRHDRGFITRAERRHHDETHPDWNTLTTGDLMRAWERLPGICRLCAKEASAVLRDRGCPGPPAF